MAAMEWGGTGWAGSGWQAVDREVTAVARRWGLGGRPPAEAEEAVVNVAEGFKEGWGLEVG